MLDWIEENIGEKPTLTKMSEQIGYSPYYCSVQFHKICGMTIKRYISGRRLALAALELRDTKERIIDIAFKYGFSSRRTEETLYPFRCRYERWFSSPNTITSSIKEELK